MKSTLLELVTSKKFLAAVTAIAVYVAGRFGFEIDQAALDHIFAALLVYVGAQGVADAGKSAAQIRAVTATAGMTPESSDALKRIASSTAVLGIVIVAVLLQAGCAAAKHEAVVAKDAVVLCTKADPGKLLALVGELAADVVGTALHAGGIDWAALATRAKAEGVTVGGCAFAALYKALEDREPATAMRTLVAQPDVARTELERLRSALGGPRWQLADGSVL